MIAVSEFAGWKNIQEARGALHADSHRVGLGRHWAMEKIGLPMEEELSTVRSISSIDTCFPDVFRGQSALNAVQTWTSPIVKCEIRMERASLRFPEGVDDYRITKYGGASASVCHMSIRYNDDTDLYNNVEKHLIRPIQRIDGVADVSFQIP